MTLIGPAWELLPVVLVAASIKKFHRIGVQLRDRALLPRITLPASLYICLTMSRCRTAQRVIGSVAPAGLGLDSLLSYT